MDKDVLREINQYFAINNDNIERMNTTLATMQSTITDLTHLVTDLGQHIDLLEKTYQLKQKLKN